MNPAAGNILPTSAGDFGPRFGIAWSPGADRKMVFRGGYALMYNQMPLNIPLLMWQSAPHLAADCHALLPPEPHCRA